MDRSIAYAETFSNFGSAYNALPQAVYTAPARTATYPSFLFNGNRPSSPLFRRTASPPPRFVIPDGTGPKFNFDLYKMDGTEDDTLIRSTRPTSPTPLVLHHYPIASALSHSVTEPPALSKLREANDELYHALARSELSDPSPPPTKPVAPHYHIHHYPVSQHPSQTYRTRSPPEYFSPSVDFEPSPRVNKARVTYKIRIPRRPPPEESRRVPNDDEQIYVSEESPSDDPIVVDLYPSRDRGVQTQRDKHSHDPSPWVVHGVSVRRNSYSDASTPQSSKRHHELYYGDKPIKTHRQTTHRKDRQPSGVRHPAPFVSPRYRPDSAPAYESDPYRDPIPNIVHSEVSGRPTTSHKSSQTKAPLYDKPWDEGGVKRRNKHILAFDSSDESSTRPTYEKTPRRRTPPDSESESKTYRKTYSDRPKIRPTDPKLKERIANAQSKVKTAWEPTAHGMSSRTTTDQRRPSASSKKKAKDQSIVSESETPSGRRSPSFIEPPTTISHGQHSISDIPKQSPTELTPRLENGASRKDETVPGTPKDQSRMSDQSRKDREPTPPIASPPPAPEEEPEHGDQSAVSHDASGDVPAETTNPVGPPIDDQEPDSVVPVDNNDEIVDRESKPPSPAPPAEEPKAKTPSPAPAETTNDSVKKDEGENDDGGDDDDQEVARSFDIHTWLNEASKAIQGAAKAKDTHIPSTPPPVPPPPPPKVTQRTTPRRKVQPHSPTPSSPDRDLYKPPFGPKRDKTEPKPASPSPPPAAPITTTATTGDEKDVDDFFS